MKKGVGAVDVYIGVTTVELSFDWAEVYFPKHWDQSLDDDGELIEVTEYEMEDKFEAWLWDNVDVLGAGSIRAFTKGCGANIPYTLQVELMDGEEISSVRDRVKECVEEWNHYAEETEVQTLIWYRELKESEDPLGMDDFDVMI